MIKFEWQEGLDEKIDILCRIFPSAVKDFWKTRLIYEAEKIATDKGSTIVTEDILWESVNEAYLGRYELPHTKGEGFG